MILVDTSVMISYLRGDKNKASKYFHSVMEEGDLYFLPSFTVFEVLQGAKSQKDFDSLHLFLSTLPICGLLNGNVSLEDAGKISFTCRKNGFTIRSSLDFLIAQIAIENRFRLLHQDSDFITIAKFFPNLLLVDLK